MCIRLEYDLTGGGAERSQQLHPHCQAQGVSCGGGQAEKKLKAPSYNNHIRQITVGGMQDKAG